ncbi:MAG: hypothetical protein HRU70_11725 [Phycisphaeraceae bacterium]|nr:MAG: hypothetical protein HRU70_11725 [Phycisphaeraceae bacterium]
MNTIPAPIRLATTIALAFALAGCDRRSDQPSPGDDHEHGAGPAAASTTPTNRVDIPAAVRQNLGITFVKVEPRNVAQTLRVPGRFELLPTARREYRTPLAGRVDLLVTQYQKVERGTPLYRVDAAGWQDLHEQIAATRALADSMGPRRDAHRQHEQSLAEKVALWQDRLKQLDALQSAGGGSAAQFTEARAALNATQAELADVMEKDAELQAQQTQAEAQLRSLVSRRDLLLNDTHCGEAPDGPGSARGYTVCSVAPGVVEAIGITPGGLAQENGHILTLLQPDRIRFRARALQSDLGRLRDGLPARIAPPQGGSTPLQDTMSGVLFIGPAADADERTIDLIVTPDSLSPWARSGVVAHLEITLADGGEALAIPLSAVVRDGATPYIFRRDPANPDKAIRVEADLGLSDGRWVVIRSGVREGDEIVLGGNYPLMLATSAAAPRGGHFHPDGTFHEGEH